MNIRTLLITGLALALSASAGAASAQAQNPAEAPPAAVSQSAPMLADASSAYVLGRDDVVEIGLLGGTGFGGRVRVQADGMVQLPLIGKIQAADRTTAELADLIRQTLRTGGYFADPVVTVEVVTYASRYVTVLGAVGSPGLIPMSRPYRLSEVLARVGGTRDNAADYVVVRPAVGEEKRYAIRDLATGSASDDPFVAAGDKIFIPVAETYYIYGQVNSPGAFQLQSGMTVRMAIAKAGGLTESGTDKKVNATRAGKKVKIAADNPVQAGDILVVGERLF